MKIDKNIWMILGVVVIVAIAAVFLTSKPPEEVPVVIPEEEEMEVKLVTGAGYSIQKDSKEAVQEAYDRMKTQLGGSVPNFAILYSTIGYDQDRVLSELNRLLPGAKIYGYTSIIGTMTNEGFHVGEGVSEGNSISLMGFSSDSLTAGVGAAALGEVDSPREAGRLAITRAIEDAGKAKADQPKLVFITTSPFGRGMEEEIIAGVEEILGEGKVPIMGGIASGDAAYTGGWRMFANDKIYEEGVVVTPIYTDLKVGYIYSSGFNPTEEKGVVTKFEKGAERIIGEIDNKPAGGVVNGWLDGLLEDHLNTSDIVIPIMGVHPLGIKTIETGGYVNWALIYVWWFHPDNSLTVGVSAPEGTEVYLLEGDPELLIKRPSLTARLARSRGKITEKEIAGVVMDHCGGTMRAIPQNRVGEMTPLVNEAIGNAPFIGSFNSGNYGYFAGVGNRYGNMMISMAVFSKD